MRHDNRGFTLIELLIVVVIIGILVAIVVPKFANGKERAMVAAMKSDLHNLLYGAGGVLLQRHDVLQRRAARRRAAVGPVGRRLGHPQQRDRERMGGQGDAHLQYADLRHLRRQRGSDRPGHGGGRRWRCTP